MTRSFSSVGLVSAACSLLVGCALLSKAEPLVPRYFTPEDRAPARPAAGYPAASEARKVRLGNVHGSSQLRERIMFRDSAREVGYYEDRRWTERPEAYMRRALARELFEARGLVRVPSGSAPTLEVELVAFEELRVTRHAVRVQAIMTLDDGSIGSLQQTVTIEQVVQSDTHGDGAAATVDAFALALHLCVAEIADHVLAKLPSAERM